jgi:hypothetical protein
VDTFPELLGTLLRFPCERKLILKYSLVFKVTPGKGLITRWSLVQVQLAPLFLPILHQLVRCSFVHRSKNEKTVDAHIMHTEPLKSTVRSSKLKGADMRGIQKITNKDGTKSYRAQVRLNDGLSPQSKSFPSLVEARTWNSMIKFFLVEENSKL